MCFWIMHIVSKFQIFIHIFTVVNRKSKNQNFKMYNITDTIVTYFI